MMTAPTIHQRRAFTLTELIVAIGAVAILTVGVGRIFNSISALVGTGVAVAEIEQVARTIEERMRRDFALLAQMNEDETYIAIRMREIGHPQRPIYLTRDDREADVRDGIAPYEPGSRAVYRRLDEMVFLAGDGNPTTFTSAQRDALFTESVVQSGYARIYYGQGLRPKPDNAWPLDPPDPNRRIPQRIYEPDGYFGDPPASNDPNPIASDRPITGRNEYAADWTLVRHPVLLAGAQASGEAAGYITGRFPTMGRNREFAPYIRDLETITRIWPNLGPSLGPNALNEFGNRTEFPDPRLLRHGRVDVVAQSLEDVRRFLEGEPNQLDGGVVDPNNAALFAYPFEPGVGRFGSDAPDPAREFSANIMTNVLQRPLWRWPEVPTAANTIAASRPRYAQSLLGVRSAIAGTIIRPLADPQPPAVDRIFAANQIDVEGPEDAFMDTHAVIAARCSHFEIAWSDGSVAKLTPSVQAGQTSPLFFTGDLMWYDITRTDPTRPNVWEGNYRRTLARFSGGDIVSWVNVNPYVFGPSATVPDVDGSLRTSPEIPPAFETIWLNQALPGVPSSPPGVAVYNADITGGAPSWISSPDNFEMLTIFPFRDAPRSGSRTTSAPPEPNAGVGFGPESDRWPKPRFIRVRMILHDAQGLLPEGRRYEFVFSTNLREG